MTSVTVVIGGHTVSNSVIDVDIWMNKKTCIGVCQLRIDNTADQWGDDFEPNDALLVSINDILMFSGTVDNVMPELDKKGVLSNYITVRGRDGGRRLDDLYYTENFVSTRSGAIIDTILAGVGDPLLYTDPGATPFIKYNSQRTKLTDSFKDICDLSAWDMYIDTTGRIQFFASGTTASGVALKSVAAAIDNNLLFFEEYEEIGYDIKNLIEVHAGSVKDHYTDGGAAQWTDLLAGGTTFSDETAVYIYGSESIKVVAADNDETFGLDFTVGAAPYYLYSQGGTIDMSKFAQNKVVFRHDDASTGNYSFLPYLKDGGGNEIVFTRNSSGQGKDGFTNNITTTVDKWRSLSYQTGEHVSNEVVAIPQSGRWSGDVGFDWTDVVAIGFNLVTEATMDTIYIDAWYMPAIEAKSIVTDAASVGDYDTRMYSEYRKDLKSQTALDAESAKILAYRKDPLRKFKATASGQTGTKYASQTVTVEADSHGVDDTYIIITLHHILHNDTNTRGWDFITKYELALSAVDSTRILSDDDPMQALLLKLARENRGFKGSQTDDEYWLGDITTGFVPQITTGATFPTDMNIGDEFFLTADLTAGANEYYGPALYRYDGDAADWLRDPIVMHRAADPPAGGEVIYDTLHRTDLDRWYRWTGAWTLINFAAGTISGEIVASQLAIEQRDWKSNLNFIWDVANKDWDEIWWGETDDEKNTDAVIEFSDGTTTTVDKGTEAALADGTYVYYWDENFKAGGTYQLQRDTYANYDNAVGTGKGLMAIVVIDEAAKESPSFFLFNSYAATIGTGLLSAWTVKTIHLTSESIHGKDIATQASVGEAAGNAGIRIIGDAADIVGTAIGDGIGGNFAAGIYGFKAGPARTFYLDPATGKIIVYGEGSFDLRKSDGTAVGTVDMMVEGGRDVIKILTVGATKDIILESGGYSMKLRGDGDIDILGAAVVDVGTASSRMVLPQFNGADPDDGGGAPRAGEVWVRVDL